MKKVEYELSVRMRDLKELRAEGDAKISQQLEIIVNLEKTNLSHQETIETLERRRDFLENQLKMLDMEHKIVTEENQLLESSKAKLRVENADQKVTVDRLAKLAGVKKKKK